jgi:hypothetical protein
VEVPTYTQPVSIVAVIYTDTAMGGQKGYADATNNYAAAYINGTAFGCYAGSALQVGTAAQSTWYRVTTVINGNSSEIFTNGVSAGSGAAGSGNLNGITIGNLNSGTVSWPGYIAEVIIYDALLSSTDIGNIDTYLTSKYGL